MPTEAQEKKTIIELIDNNQNGMSWTVRITFPNGDIWEDEFADGGDAAESAKEWKQRLGSVKQTGYAEGLEAAADMNKEWSFSNSERLRAALDSFK